MSGLDRRAFLLGAAGLAGAACVPGRLLTSEAWAKADPRLTALGKKLAGPVIVPGSPPYDRARVVYNERFDAVHPLAVARPFGVGDVQKIVAWSRTTGIRLSIRSGGHSYAGYSTGPGLVVDLRRLDGIQLDRATGRATIGAGARLVDVEAALAAHGRAIPGGSCATVGIGGLAQGGGVGLASRKLGTTSDNVISLGIVTADGRYRICNRNENQDLFWACRGGGGGNFGIVTHLTFRTHAVSAVSYFFADWSWAQAPHAIEAWQSFAPHAPDELFSICSLGTGGTAPGVSAFGQYMGPEQALRGLLGPFAAVPGLRLSTGSSSYRSAQLRWAGCLGKTAAQCHLAGETPQGTLQRSLFTGKSDYLSAPLTAAGRAAIVDWIERAQAMRFGSAALLLDSYGGALNRPAPNATAFVHRAALGSAQYLAYWSDATKEAAALGWIRGFHAAMRPYVSGFAYQNYIDHDLADWPHAYYGANYPRLQAVKKAVDPHELFRFAQSIRPA